MHARRSDSELARDGWAGVRRMKGAELMHAFLARSRKPAAIPVGLRALATGVLALTAACGGGETREHRVVDAALEPLRSDFTADSGKVRAILLASPT